MKYCIAILSCLALGLLAGCSKDVNPIVPAVDVQPASRTSDTSAPKQAEDTAAADQVEANRVIEIALHSQAEYENPFMDVELNAVVTQPDGTELRVPAFWAGDDRWCFRYASPQLGEHEWKTECTDTANEGLQAIEGTIEVVATTGDNPLYLHGPIRVAADQRHFEHVDGTPFFWLGDTWWKNLCKRLTWEGFQQLTADRRAKGFSVVQIVCGPYPDEGHFEDRWENEGGKPYITRDFSQLNPVYFEYADRRLLHLADAGLLPAIVGGWGRPDCDGMALAGIDGIKRHWRNLVARYGAYPTVWIIGGESHGPLWTEAAKYVRSIDPYHRPITMHPYDSGRTSVTDDSAIDFDMLQTGHGDWNAAFGAIPKFKTAYERMPPMPVMIGEYAYEGHMQNAFPDVQRYVFWGSMLSGSAGLTYGAAGVWHASVEGDPGLANVYDLTTWEEGMNKPGSTQLGLGKKFLEQYPWERFEPHPEWAEEGSFAAGIPGEVRFIYMPKRGVYNWQGPRVYSLDPGVIYHAFYFDPVAGRRRDVGTVVDLGPPSESCPRHTEPIVLADSFDDEEAAKWKDWGSPTERTGGQLVGGKDLVTTLVDFDEANVTASVAARSDAEAGIILRFHDPDNYLVALYTPSLHAIYIHDRRGGDYGPPLGRVDVPEIGPDIQLTAAACGNLAAFALTDGEHEYCTPVVRVANIEPGSAGVWLYQVGEQQQFDDFELSRSCFLQFDAAGGTPDIVLNGGELNATPAPSPQDWVLVMERVEP